MKKILVIDDDTDILELISAMLRMHKYDVKTSPHWESIPEYIKQFQPGLLLLDVSLGGADGRNICKELKADPSNRDLPIVLFSADPDMGRGMKDYGANEFMPKPFELSTLLSIIESQTAAAPLPG